MDGSSVNPPPRPPQPSAKGQQGTPEIVATYAELIDAYREGASVVHQQSLIDNITLRKLRAALVERDEALAECDVHLAERSAQIAELEAEVAALKESATRAPAAVGFEATAGQLLAADLGQAFAEHKSA